MQNSKRSGKFLTPNLLPNPSHEIRFLNSFRKSRFRLRISVQSFPCSPIPLQKSLSKERAHHASLRQPQQTTVNFRPRLASACFSFIFSP